MGKRYKNDEERKAAIKASKAASQRKIKAAMTPEQRAKQRAAHTESERKRRAALTHEQIIQSRAAHTESERKRRAALTHEQIIQSRAAHTESERKRRAVMTHEQLIQYRAVHTERERKRRAALNHELQIKSRAANTEYKRKNRAVMTHEQQIQYRAGHTERERKRRAAWNHEQQIKYRAVHTERERKRRAAMTHEQRIKIRAANTESARRRRAAKRGTEEVHATATAKLMLYRKGKLLGTTWTKEEQEKMVAEYLEARAKKLAAMTEEERNKWKAARSGVNRKYSEMSEEERQNWKVKVFAKREKHTLREMREKADNKTRQQRIEKLISLSMDAATRNPERYEKAGTFVKNILLEIGFLHVELGDLKKQLKQTLSEAVRNAVKTHRDEKQRMSESHSPRFVEVPLSFETDKTTTFGNSIDPLLLQPEEYTETPHPAGENVDLQKQNHEIFEVFAHDSTTDKNSKHANTIKEWECSICPKKFETSLGLTIHQKNHAIDSNEFKCSICSEIFANYNLVATHYLQDHYCEFHDNNFEKSNAENEEIDDEFEKCLREMDFLFSRKCLICFKTLGLQTATLAMFSKHMIEHHSGNNLIKYFTHICARCGKPHPIIRSLESHWKTICFRRWKDKRKDNHHEVVCEQCGSRFSNEKSLFSHLKLYHAAKKYICEQCGNQFKNKASLKWHVKWVHETQYSWSCEHCNQKFKSQKCLQKHMKIVHLGEKKLVCKFCSKRFANETNLEYHENTHTGEKPYECHLCGKTFAAKSSLVAHKGIHEGFICKICGEGFANYSDLCTHRKLNHNSRGVSDSSEANKNHPIPTSCDICGKSVMGFMSLRNHKLSVHQGKNYVCDICGKSYTTPGALKNHKYSHDNLKRFGCNLCGRKFRQATNFYQHRKVAHVNENAQIVKLISDRKNANNLEHASKSEQYSNAEQEQNSNQTSEVTNIDFSKNTDPVAPTTSRSSLESLENEDSTGLDDYFSEIEINDTQENDDIPQFEISELRNARPENIIPTLVTRKTQNCTSLKKNIFEKTPADHSPPISSEFNKYSQSSVPLGFSELCDEESNAQLTKPNNESVKGKDNQHQVLIEDSEQNSFITDLSIHDIVKLKSETLDGIAEEDQDDVSDIFDSNDFSENENEVQNASEKIQCKSKRDSRIIDLKFPQFVSSSRPVVKLTKLLEYYCLLCDKTIFATSQRELRQHPRTHRDDISQNKKKYILKKKKHESKKMKHESKKKKHESKKKKIGSSQDSEKIKGLYDCLYCDMKEFKTTTAIIEHCSKEHPGQSPLQCKVCSRMFNTGKTFLNHKSMVHNSALDPIGTKSEFLCEVCGKSFTTEKNVKWHAIRMHQERKFQCDLCPKLFFKMRDLQTHKIRHSGIRPHLCEECGKAFFTPHELTDHIERVHKKIEKRKQNASLKEKSSVTHPFSCEMCPYVFKKESGLERHLKLHDSSRKHSCDECGLRFILHSNVLDHKDSKHRKNGKRNIKPQ